MKKKLVFALSLISILAFSNSFALFDPEPEEKRIKIEVIEFPGVKADKLFDLTCLWLAESFGSSKEVVELKDKESKKIVGNIVTTFNVFVTKFNVQTVLKIEIKDGKTRITYNPHHIYFEGPTIDRREIYGTSELEKTHKTLDEVTALYKNYITKNMDAKDSDW